MMQTWENGKTLIPDSISGSQFFFLGFYPYYLDIFPNYHPIKFRGKLMKQTWENSEKPNFGPNFESFRPNLGPQTFL